MQITRTYPRLGQGRLTTPQDKATTIPPDAIDLSELPPDAKRVRPIESTFESMEVKPPKLERPLLMVHGLAQHADTWATFKTHLCSRPENQWGGVFHVDKEKEFQENLKDQPEAKVFALDISDNLVAPRVVANEVRRAITAIMKATGAESVDLMTHSMGSLVTREAIRQGEQGIANLLMISPPNQGAYEATAATLLSGSGVYAHYPDAKMGAMDALRLEYDSRGKVTNEWLHGLNEFWKSDKNRPRASIITGIGIPTPDRSKTATAPGDGMVAARRAPLEGAEFHLAVPNNLPADDPNFRDFQQFRYNHLQVVSEPEIWQTAGEFLAGGSDKKVAEENFEQELDRAQEANIALRKQVDFADQDRVALESKQRKSTILAAAGAATALFGMASGNSLGYLGPVLTLAGVAGLGVGSMQAFKHAGKLGQNSKQVVDSAERSLNIADDLIHRHQRHGREDTLGVRNIMDKTRESRTSLVEADFNRRHSQLWQGRGMRTAAIGAAVAGAGMAGRSAFPLLGGIATVAGGLAIGGGVLVGLIQSSKLGEPADVAARVAVESVNLTDSVIQDFRREG